MRKLQKPAQEQVIRAIEKLQRDGHPRDAEKLRCNPSFYRMKVGKEHRVIYHIFQKRLIVVLVVRSRKDAYRGLEELDGKLDRALGEAITNTVRLASAG